MALVTWFGRETQENCPGQARECFIAVSISEHTENGINNPLEGCEISWAVHLQLAKFVEKFFNFRCL